jgi:hypothetical protein
MGKGKSREKTGRNRKKKEGGRIWDRMNRIYGILLIL